MISAHPAPSTAIAEAEVSRFSAGNSQVPLIAVLTIGGLSCRYCARRIAEVLAADPRVLGAGVDAGRGTVDVLFDAGRLSTEAIAAIIVLCAAGAPRQNGARRTQTQMM